MANKLLDMIKALREQEGSQVPLRPFEPGTQEDKELFEQFKAGEESEFDEGDGDVGVPVNEQARAEIEAQIDASGGASAMAKEAKKPIIEQRAREELSQRIASGDFAGAAQILSVMKQDMTADALMADQIRNIRRRRRGEKPRFDMSRSRLFQGEKKSPMEILSDAADRESKKAIREKEASMKERMFNLQMLNFQQGMIKSIEAGELAEEKLDSLRKKNQAIGSADAIRIRTSIKQLQDNLKIINNLARNAGSKQKKELTKQGQAMLKQVQSLQKKLKAELKKR